jgi:hypothetical protein
MKAELMFSKANSLLILGIMLASFRANVLP